MVRTLRQPVLQVTPDAASASGAVLRRMSQGGEQRLGDDDRAERAEMQALGLVHRFPLRVERQRRVVGEGRDVVVVQSAERPVFAQPRGQLRRPPGVIVEHAGETDEVGAAAADLLNQGAHGPEAGEGRAHVVAIGEADAAAGVDGGKYLLAEETAAVVRPDALGEVRPAAVDFEEMRPLHHPAFVERHVAGIGERSFGEVLQEIVGRAVVDAILVAHQRMTEADRALREFERRAPFALGDRRMGEQRARFVGGVDARIEQACAAGLRAPRCGTPRR